MPRRAFTIVEMIVVLAVIALLLGLLLPALTGARTAARASASQSNLRQLFLAATSYANVHESYPLALEYREVDGTYRIVAWDWVTTFTGELVGPGPIWMYTDNPDRVMQCPGYAGVTNAPGNPYTGYNYSTYIAGEQRASDLKVFPGARPHSIRQADRVAMFGLGGYAGGTNKFMRSPVHNDHSEMPLDPATIYSGGQAFRFDRATVTTFADGHVASSRDPRPGVNATDELLQEHMNHPRNGFLSDDEHAYKPR